MSIELKWIEISSKFCLYDNQISLLSIIVFAVIVQTTDILNDVSQVVEQSQQKQSRVNNHLRGHRKQSALG